MKQSKKATNAAPAGASNLIPHRSTVVKLSELVDNPDNPRPHVSPESVEGLRASIARHGLLQPLVVARVPNLSGAMIVCGHRRAAALRGLMPPSALIPVLELVIPDARTSPEAGEPSEVIRREIDLAALVENGQRLELDPIREGQAIADILQLAEGRLSVADVAGDLGRSRAYVDDRLQLARLSPRWIAAYRNELEEQSETSTKRRPDGLAHRSDPFRCDTWPVRWLVLVSTLNAAAQDDLLAAWIEEPYERPISFSDLRAAISGKLQTLGQAPFDVTREGLAGCVSCAACPKHTMARPALFDEPTPPKVLASARCPDADCYAAKSREGLREALEAAKAKHPEVLVVGFDAEDVKASGAGDGVKVAPRYHVQEVKKTDKGARPALDRGANGQPKVVYVRPIADPEGDGKKAAKRPAAKPKTLHAKRAALELRRLRLRCGMLADHLSKASPVELAQAWVDSFSFHPRSVLALADVFGVPADPSGAKRWAAALPAGALDGRDVSKLAKRVAHELARYARWYTDDRLQVCFEVAALGFGIGPATVAEWSARAVSEIPEPAAWSKAQATPKAEAAAKGKAKPKAKAKAAPKAKADPKPKASRARRTAKGKAAAAGDTDHEDDPQGRPPFTPAPETLIAAEGRELVSVLEARETTDRCAACGALVVWWRAPSGADVALERASAILVVEKGGRSLLMLRHRCSPPPRWGSSTDAP